MRAYLELKDILCRVKHGTVVYLIDLATDIIESSFVVGKYDYEKNLSRESLNGEPFDIIVDNNTMIIVVSKDD